MLDDGGYGEVDRLLLADAQTSGGLLFGAAPDRAAAAVAELGAAAAVVGRVRAGRADPAAIANTGPVATVDKR